MVHKIRKLKKYRFLQGLEVFVMPEIITFGESVACLALPSMLEEKIMEEYNIKVKVNRIYTNKHTRYKIALEDGDFIDFFITHKTKI